MPASGDNDHPVVESRRRDWQQLVHFDDNAGPNAIELYVARLRRKLEAAPLRVVTVRRAGYLLEPIVEARGHEACD